MLPSFVSLYVYVFCTALNSECWTETPDAVGSADEVLHGVETVEHCQASCVGKADCQAIDYIPSNKTCYIIHSLGSASYTQPNVVTHHELNRLCITS